MGDFTKVVPGSMNPITKIVRLDKLGGVISGIAIDRFENSMVHTPNMSHTPITARTPIMLHPRLMTQAAVINQMLVINSSE